MSIDTTSLLDPDATQPKHITWGTSTLKFPAEITLQLPEIVPVIRLNVTQPVILGRASRNHAAEHMLDLTPYNAIACGVSRRHLQLELVQETLQLTDLNSANGTYLNNQKLLAYKGYVMRDGDEIRLGYLSVHVYF